MGTPKVAVTVGVFPMVEVTVAVGFIEVVKVGV
jgi:hypothetical protein